METTRSRLMIVVFIVIAFIVIPLRAQKSPAQKTLSERYGRLNCSIVQLTSPGSSGSGFFVSADGDLVTAAHVALNRQFSEPQPGTIHVQIDYKPGLSLIRNGVEPAVLSLPKLGPLDVLRAINDLAVLKTGIKTDCFLPLSTSAEERIGDHVILIGFPPSAPGGALYEGFVSARYTHLPIPVAQTTDTRKPVTINYRVTRVQMPVTPGVSGAPIIADDDRVIGVMSELPIVWFRDLAAVIEQVQKRPGGITAPASDLVTLLAKVAWVVQQFETPGAGLAVPISYLRWPEKKETESGKKTTLNPEQRPHQNWFRALIGRLT